MKNLKRNWVFLFMFFVTNILENSKSYKEGDLTIVGAALVIWVVLALKLISILIYLIEIERQQKKIEKKKTVAGTTVNK